MLVATLLGSTFAAFAMFVIACWAIYLNGLRRIRHMAAAETVSAYPLAMGGLSPSMPNN
jgi:hypothetical protein